MVVLLRVPLLNLSVEPSFESKGLKPIWNPFETSLKPARLWIFCCSNANWSMRPGHVGSSCKMWANKHCTGTRDGTPRELKESARRISGSPFVTLLDGDGEPFKRIVRTIEIMEDFECSTVVEQPMIMVNALTAILWCQANPMPEAIGACGVEVTWPS